jgi:T-complex protein 1 subunit beta
MAQTVKETRTVCGGGSSEMLMANVVSQLAARTPGKEAVAIEAYAKALRMLPTIIADNGGYDSAELVSKLRAYHTDGKISYGLDMERGEVADMRALGIMESYRVKQQVVISGSEAAEMILRVDSILRAAPRKRQADHRPC